MLVIIIIVVVFVLIVAILSSYFYVRKRRAKANLKKNRFNPVAIKLLLLKNNNQKCRLNSLLHLLLINKLYNNLIPNHNPYNLTRFS